ncbi:MAG: DUF4124 domain-containing protein [Proteobacteria bacterium]|nr:DUF4124 domain-containing protein [Pseudomonadota bacterium]
MKRLALCTVLLTFSALSSATVYKWVDAQGKTLYGDRPPDGVKAEVVQLLGNRAPASTPTRASDTHASNTAPMRGTTSAPADVGTRKAVDQDVSEARAKQCADAQERYRKLIEGRRIYREGKDGERQYLTSEEIDSARLNAKTEIDAACGGTS